MTAVFGDKRYYSDQAKRAARKMNVHRAALDKAKRIRKIVNCLLGYWKIRPRAWQSMPRRCFC
jgi:hypothetical protein